MQSSSSLRSVAGYVLVVLVLGAAIFGGLQLTKNRNSTVTAAPTSPLSPVGIGSQGGDDTNKPVEQPKTQTPAPKTTKPNTSPSTTPATPSTQPKANNPVAATTPSTPKVQTPVHIPSTGAEDTFVAPLALMGLVFAVFMYTQSRRRLLALR